MSAPLSIDEMKKIASSRGGKCLSRKYISAHTKLIWMCNVRHKFEATPANVKKNRWCPFCAGKRKSISEMKALAKAKEGKCLSKKFMGNKVPLLWLCKSGHRFSMRPDGVLHQKSWCPKCLGRNKTIDDLIRLARSIDPNAKLLTKE